MSFFARFVFACCTLLMVTRGLADAPDWVKAAALLPTPVSAAKAPAIVLLDETSVEVDANGVSVETHRMAIRILHDAGKDRASAQVRYNGKSDKVLSLGAWLLRGKETIETKKKSEWVDLATGSAGAAVDEQRTIYASLSGRALVDDVFGSETQVRVPLLVAQMPFSFGSDLPVLTKRVSLGLPPGFSIDPKVYGPVPPVESASPSTHAWTWTALDRPYRPDEPWEASGARIDATVFVRINAPAGFAPYSFSNWAQVLELYAKLNVGQCDSSPGLEAKVRELIAGQSDDLAKIRALGAHVQKLRYIAINTGLSSGFGYKSRKASTVFSTGYGDCKDKANVLVAMLREAGVTAYPVSAYSGKEWTVKPDCPTPTQFNHAIVAIRINDAVQLPAVVTVEPVGRLLIFDPTDPYTQVGDIPFSLQGSLVHVEIPGNNLLTALPNFSAAEDFTLTRRMEMALSPEGAVTVRGRVSATGQIGARLRAQFEQASLPKDLEKFVSQQLNDKFRGAAVQEKKTEDDPLSGRCTLSFTCAQPNFLQWLQGRTAIVKLDILSRQHLPNFSEKERVLPIYLQPLALNDEIVLSIPAGYKVDEVPAKTSLESPFGSCRLTFEEGAGTLLLKREVVIHQATIPVTEYAKLRQFLSDIAKADRASLLLKPQG
jgi:hypothetical protein